MSVEILFFPTPRDLRDWFEENHQSAAEVWIGFHKRDSGKASITWPESVDEALCVGWIDGIRKSIDEVSYKIRFTPRRPRSIWSAVNIKRVAVLTAEGRMREAGNKAFKARTENRSGVYAYEQRKHELDAEYEKIFRKNAVAWKGFNVLPPGYRRTASWWVMSAKQEATRLKRLAQLMEDSANGRRIKHLARPGPKA